MGYNHTLSTDAQLKAGTTPEAVVNAFRPILEYFQYNGCKAFAGEELNTDHEFKFDPVTGELYIYTCGDVCDYLQRVKECAKKLGPLTESPSVFILKDFNTVDLENAVTDIYYGQSEEIVRHARFTKKLEVVLTYLMGYLPGETIEQIRSTATAAVIPADPANKSTLSLNELVAKSIAGQIVLGIKVALPLYVRVEIDQSDLETISESVTLIPRVTDHVTNQLAGMSDQDIRQLVEGYRIDTITDGLTGETMAGSNRETFQGYFGYQGTTLNAEFDVAAGATIAEKDSAFMAALAQKADIDYVSISTTTEKIS